MNYHHYIRAIFDTHEQIGKKSCLLHATTQCALGHSLRLIGAVFIVLCCVVLESSLGQPVTRCLFIESA